MLTIEDISMDADVHVRKISWNGICIAEEISDETNRRYISRSIEYVPEFHGYLTEHVGSEDYMTVEILEARLKVLQPDL